MRSLGIRDRWGEIWCLVHAKIAVQAGRFLLWNPFLGTESVFVNAKVAEGWSWKKEAKMSKCSGCKLFKALVKQRSRRREWMRAKRAEKKLLDHALKVWTPHFRKLFPRKPSRYWLIYICKCEGRSLALTYFNRALMAPSHRARFFYGASWVQKAVLLVISQWQHVSVAVNIKTVQAFVTTAGAEINLCRRKDSMIQARCKECGRSFDVYVVHQSHSTKEFCDDCLRARRNKCSTDYNRRKREMACA